MMVKCDLSKEYGEHCVYDTLPYRRLMCEVAFLEKEFNELIRELPVLKRYVKEYNCPNYEPLSKYQLKKDPDKR